MMDFPKLTPPMPLVQPDKFLFDYKILIFALIILVVSSILACKKKPLQKAMITLVASDVIVTIIYIYNRIYETGRWGYCYFLETNDDFNVFWMHLLGMIVLFSIIFLSEKVIERIKGGK